MIEAATMTLRDKSWSPYAAGVLIGLLQYPASYSSKPR